MGRCAFWGCVRTRRLEIGGPIAFGGPDGEVVWDMLDVVCSPETWVVFFEVFGEVGEFVSER